MNSKALQRLDDAVRRLVAKHGQTATRAAQLAAALAKSREEIEKLKTQNFRFKNERAETRKKLDIVVRRLDRLVEPGAGRPSDA